MTGTGLRDDTTLGAIRLEWWAASDWNGARITFGIPGRLRRNPQPAVCGIVSKYFDKSASSASEYEPRISKNGH